MCDGLPALTHASAGLEQGVNCVEIWVGWGGGERETFQGGGGQLEVGLEAGGWEASLGPALTLDPNLHSQASWSSGYSCLLEIRSLPKSQ